MSPLSKDAIEAAQGVLSAIAEGRKPEPAAIEKLRRLAPPLANMPPAELATKVMQLVSEISGKDREAAKPPIATPEGRKPRGRRRRSGTVLRRA